MHPLAVIVVAALAAAAMAALGALPLRSVRPFPKQILGWATALASGIMLGVAYALMTVALDRGATAGGLGALAGIAAITMVRAVVDAGNAFRSSAVHAIPEGVAIGVAAAVGVPFGLMMAAALAVHNVPEGTVTITGLLARGRRLPAATLLAVVANLNQVLFAILAVLAVQAAPPLLPWTLGFAVGSLLYLVMAELLPHSYREAGRTSIALVTIVAVAILVLLHNRST